MIHFFCPLEAANEWLYKHPEERVVAIAAGNLSGSVLVATEKRETAGDILHNATKRKQSR